MKNVDRDQRDILKWEVREFGDIAREPTERALRLLEEATEAAQAMGVSRQQAEAIIERCYSRPAGAPAVELGQVGLSLLAACQSFGYSAAALWEDEFTRLLSFPHGHFHARHNEKVRAGIASEMK